MHALVAGLAQRHADSMAHELPLFRGHRGSQGRFDPAARRRDPVRKIGCRLERASDPKDVVGIRITILAIVIHHVRGPIQLPNGRGLRGCLARLRAVDQFDRGVPRRMAVSRTHKDRLLANRGHTAFHPPVTTEGRFGPIENGPRIAVRVWAPLGMFENVPC